MSSNSTIIDEFGVRVVSQDEATNRIIFEDDLADESVVLFNVKVKRSAVQFSTTVGALRAWVRSQQPDGHFAEQSRAINQKIADLERAK